MHAQLPLGGQIGLDFTGDKRRKLDSAGTTPSLGSDGWPVLRIVSAGGNWPRLPTVTRIGTTRPGKC